VLFSPAELPPPEVLRRRHLVLVLIEECLAGQEAPLLMFQGADPEFLAFANGSGDEYALSFVGDDALLWVFDHECPYSPWALTGDPRDWPGMLDGLPAPLERHLPGGRPRSVSAAYWYVDGSWQMGDPDPGPAVWQPGALHSDPQGVRGLITPVLSADASELVGHYYERPELVASAQRLMMLVDGGKRISDEVLRGLEPVDGVDAMHSRAADLRLI
jgi:hypothetical protein